MRDVGSTAGWRSDRLSHWQVLRRILDEGKRVSPLLQAPWVTTDIFRIDWLHCADQGVTADYLANLFRVIASKLPGANIKERTADLWRRIQLKYEAGDVQDRLQNLLPTMLKQPKKAPKLRASAAQCRALVPIAHALAQELLGAEPAEAAAKQGMVHLMHCYEALSATSIFSSDTLREQSIKFALQYVALEDISVAAGDLASWRVKPKLHLFLEVCSDGSKPAYFWCYRDEDYGGMVAHLSHRRGGLLSVEAFLRNVLDKFRIKEPVVRMLAVY